MRHTYDIKVSDRAPRSEGAGPRELGFSFESHDDLFEIVERVKAKALFATDDETKAFCLGLKLLGGVLIAHRDEEMFKDFASAFGGFMKTLKAR
jgi:hypothetical protein